MIYISYLDLYSVFSEGVGECDISWMNDNLKNSESITINLR